MDIIKPVIIIATIPVILLMGGFYLLLIGVDYMYESYQGYFFSNPND